MIFSEVKTNASDRAKQRVFERVRQHNPATRPVPITRPSLDKPKQFLSDAEGLPPQLPIVPDGETQRERHERWDRLLSMDVPWDIEIITPSGIVRRINPFRTAAPPTCSLRSSLLTGAEVAKLYDGLSFAMWGYGITMNVHVVIIWSMMGIDEVEGAKRLGRYLSEAMKWIRVGTEPRWRRVKNPREGAEMHYGWVHENTPGRGFHSHILMNVPIGLLNDFNIWSRSCLARHHGANFPYETFRIVRSYAKTKEAAVTRTWRWFQYLTKELDPAAEYVSKHPRLGVATNLMRGLIRPWPLRKGLPVQLIKMAGVSHSIGKTMQQKFRFKSMLAKGQFNRLYSGDELSDRETLKLTASLSVDDRSEYWA